MISLLGYMDFDVRRLADLLQTVNHIFPSLKKGGVRVVCTMLRRAIWRWITHHTSEFINLFQSKTRMEGVSVRPSPPHQHHSC